MSDSSHPLHSIHIALIDDEPGVVKAIELMMTALLKYKVTSFTNPEEAVKALETLTPDWIISDLRMPKLDGFDVLENRNQNCPEIPFLLISGHATDEEKAKALALGATAVLRKPFSPDEIKNLIEAQDKEKPGIQERKHSKVVG